MKSNDTLRTDLHLHEADKFYEILLLAHQDLNLAQSHALNARLVLLLANHVGSTKVLSDALKLARVATQIT